MAIFRKINLITISTLLHSDGKGRKSNKAACLLPRSVSGLFNRHAEGILPQNEAACGFHAASLGFGAIRWARGRAGKRNEAACWFHVASLGFGAVRWARGRYLATKIGLNETACGFHTASFGFGAVQRVRTKEKS